MHNHIKHALVFEEDSIREVVQKIDIVGQSGGAIGIAVVVDPSNKVIGVVTDGDIREAICNNIDFTLPISRIMSKNPLCVSASFSPNEILKKTFDEMTKRKITVSNIILIDEESKFIDVTNLHDLYRRQDLSKKTVSVYGMGFVGLTLAATLAENRHFDVEGIDLNNSVISQLKKGIPHFYEKGLDSLITQLISRKNIQFNHINNVRGYADIHIVSVGTPINSIGDPDKSFLKNCAAQIGPILKKGNLVICRSTVPVGTTRKFFIPELEKHTILRAGVDFHVAFCPERTVEGDALKELRSLPQIVGGLTTLCRDAAANVFQKITSTVVYVDTLEAAEVIKLINNSYRDLVFSFANETAYMCDSYNIDAFDVIAAANDGYPRNPIPKPSPGVGGICLSKDPILYSVHEDLASFSSVKLGKLSREINSLGADYVVWQLNKFLLKYPKENKLEILIAGIAFKGVPDTSDIRFSPAIDLLLKLKEKGCIIKCYDSIVSSRDIINLDVKFVNIKDGFKKTDAVFFMNNHPSNLSFNINDALNSMNKPALFFDGWRMFAKEHIESFDKITYATMGYMSNYDSGISRF
jgi:nucleotide sugar dehydrogenase